MEMEDGVLQALALLEDTSKQLRPMPEYLVGQELVKEKNQLDSNDAQGRLAIKVVGCRDAEEYFGVLSEPVDVTEGWDDTGCEEFVQKASSGGMEIEKEKLGKWIKRVNYWMQESSTVTSDISLLNKKLSSLVEINNAVKQQSTFLSSQASALISTSENCQALCNGIEERLKHFATVDRLSNEFSNSSLSPTSKHFNQLLADMDNTMKFLSSNKQFKSASQYLSRMHVTQQKAMVLIRDVGISSINKVSSSVSKDTRFQAIVARTKTQSRWAYLTGGKSGGSSSDLTRNASKSSLRSEGPTTEASADELNVSGSVPPGSFGLGSVLSIEFRAKLNDTLPLFESLEQRCNDDNSRVFLQDVLDAYVQVRLNLLTPIFTDYMAPHLNGSEKKDLNSMVAHGTTYLLAMATDEAELFQHLWKNTKSKAVPKQIIDTVALVLYDAFRSTVLCEDDISNLCTIIHTLNNAILSRLQTSGEAGQLLASIMSHMCQDAQERLIFRASIYVKDVITPFSYSQSECLKYCHTGETAYSKKELSEMSLAQLQEVIDKEGISVAKKEGDAAHSKEALINHILGAVSQSVAKGGPGNEAPGNLRRTFKSRYFPTLQNALNLMSALYNVVDKGVFSTIAQETIKSCTASLVQVTHTIKVTPKSIIPYAELDSKLFLVMHLLQLREQISPFEVNFNFVEKHVDLSNIRYSEISVAATQHDTKKELDQQLKQACEQFILVASHHVGSSILKFSKLLKQRVSDPLGTTEPLEQLIETVMGNFAPPTPGTPATAATAGTPGAPVSTPAPSLTSTPAPEQATPTNDLAPVPSTPPHAPAAQHDLAPEAAATDLAPESDLAPVPSTPTSSSMSKKDSERLSKGMAKMDQVVKEYRTVLERFEVGMPALMEKMKFYLSNQHTMGILFKPVKGNIIEAYVEMHSELKTFIDALVKVAGLPDNSTKNFFMHVWDPAKLVQWLKGLDPTVVGTVTGTD
eukprot:TRINITY_DN37044_c0_g1_i1.p1 TRINITY_DN37044_c0_g1~~TRINITY_DN37044_c0_g1_i1.p1  ORF type:complete len:975 (+),score=296.62 TRINITY_DN37044_c0_g1_i1:34-2958(+)